jgi:uncharacterized RDD family membrane protein YckC
MDQYQYASSPPSSTDIFTQEEFVFGGFWERFFAVFIDGIILYLPNFVFSYFLDPLSGYLVTMVIQWLYFALMESSARGATIGRMAFNLKVVSENGGRISFGQATGRYFGKIISTVILLIGYFMMLWDDRKQTLHDKMAGTLVVKA